jgi:hypothetical protein
MIDAKATLLLRQGTAAQHAAYTGPSGEVTADTTNARLVLQDGVTAGGISVAKLSEVQKRTAVADAAYTVLTTDRIVAYSSISAARAVTLPAASAYPVGVPLWIIDESGSCSGTNTITVNRAGSDTIDGATSFVLDAPYATVCLASNGSNKWTAIVGEPNLSPAMIGINTTPDSTNKLACKSSAVLFDNIGTNVQVKVNKSAAGNTASFLFQSAYSGFSECGLIGNNDFTMKVYNGSSWLDALVLPAATGIPSIPQGGIKFPATQIPSADPNTLDDYKEGSWTPSLRFNGSTTGITYFSTPVGSYVKIGRLVLGFGYMLLTSKGSFGGSDVATISGLPYTVASGINGVWIPTYYSGMASPGGQVNNKPMIGYCTNGATTIALGVPGASGGLVAITWDDFTNSANVQFAFAYFV